MFSLNCSSQYFPGRNSITVVSQVPRSHPDMNCLIDFMERLNINILLNRTPFQLRIKPDTEAKSRKTKNIKNTGSRPSSVSVNNGRSV